METYRTTAIPRVTMMVVVVVSVMVMVIAAAPASSSSTSAAPSSIRLLVPLIRVGHHVQVLVAIRPIAQTTAAATATSSRIPVQALQSLGAGASVAVAVAATSGEPRRLVGPHHRAIGHRIVVVVLVVVVAAAAVVVAVVVVNTVAMRARHSTPRRHGSTVGHPSIVGVHSTALCG